MTQANLSQANQIWHRTLDEGYQHFLEALTALQIEEAQQQLQAFNHSLARHIQFEQKHIEPLAMPWGDNTLKLIQADHLILSRLQPRLEKAFASIAQSEAARSELVRQLDQFIKMRNVLEHHDVRESETLYARLEQQLSARENQQLAANMERTRNILA